MIIDICPQVKETRDTFFKEVLDKQESLIRRLADNQEALINGAVEKKMSSLKNEGGNICKSRASKSDPSKLTPNIAATQPLASNQLVEGGDVGGSTVKAEKSLTEKATTSSLSPSAPEFVLPKNGLKTNPSEDQSKNAPGYQMVPDERSWTPDGTRWYQDPRLIFQQSGGCSRSPKFPNLQHPSFEPPSTQPLDLQHPVPNCYTGGTVMAPPIIVPDVSSNGFPGGANVSAETSEVVEIKEKFNLGEIINFVSSSWDKVSHDATLNK